MNEAKLPLWIEQCLDTMVTALSPTELKDAYQDLSRRYHDSSFQAGVRSLKEAQAYVYARLPATYAVVKSVLQKLPPDFTPRHLVDFGSGPGTATWAALEYFNSLEIIDCVEQDPWMIQMLNQLQALKNAPLTVHRQDLITFPLKESMDLGIFCYSLNELPLPKQIQYLNRLTSFQFLVLIFPGTPSHFSALRELRHQFINTGWFIHAPCTHQMSCPITGNDWCHFSERLPRLYHHRHIKNATLNYEDEKYSYLIVSKNPPLVTGGRIVKRPLKRSGHVILDVCQDGQLHRLTVSKKDSIYTQAKKASWGEIVLNKQGRS